MEEANLDLTVKNFGKILESEIFFNFYGSCVSIFFLICIITVCICLYNSFKEPQDKNMYEKYSKKVNYLFYFFSIHVICEILVHLYISVRLFFYFENRTEFFKKLFSFFSEIQKTKYGNELLQSNIALSHFFLFILILIFLVKISRNLIKDNELNKFEINLDIWSILGIALGLKFLLSVLGLGILTFLFMNSIYTMLLLWSAFTGFKRIVFLNSIK